MALIAFISTGSLSFADPAGRLAGLGKVAKEQSDDFLVDDRKLKATFEKKLGDLKDNKKARPAAEIQEELRSRKSHQCELEVEANQDALGRGEIYKHALESSLMFGNIYKCDKCSEWHGNIAGGFVLSSDGMAVTNYHVVENAKAAAFGAMTSDGRMFPVKEVLAASKADDVAIVKLDGAEDLVPLPVSADVLPGDEVTVVSHPKGLFYTLTEGVVSRQSVLQRPGGGRIPSLEITAAYAAGSSGSPVFDAKGNVVGLVKSTRSLYYNKDKSGAQQNLQMVIKFCVPASSILKLIEPEKK